MKLRVVMLSTILVLAASTAMSQVPQPAAPQQPLPAPRPAAQTPRVFGPQEPGPRPNPQAPQAFDPHEPAPALRPDVQTPQPAVPHSPAAAQAPDPIGENLFPPELVIQHKQELALTEEQKAYIKTEAIAASTRFNELQWQMQDEVEAMISLMKATSIDEQKVLAQMDKILDLEWEVKRTQMRLSIRIKNKLTPDQQMKLQKFRRHPMMPQR